MPCGRQRRSFCTSAATALPGRIGVGRHERTPRHTDTILTNTAGHAYTRGGLQTLLWNLVKRLEYLGLVGPGLCFHGLRHSLRAALYDLGLDREARKAALGHVSDAASAVYERDGNRRAASDRAFWPWSSVSRHRRYPTLTRLSGRAVNALGKHAAKSCSRRRRTG